MPSLPSSTLRRAQLPSTPHQFAQRRHASLLKRPHRPYMFTQLVTLSDGSTYTQRTTSPQPVYRSAKDTRNHFLWQPTLESLRNVEQDEAGRLRAFRNRFGRTFDLEGTTEDSLSVDARKEDKGTVAASATKGGEATVQAPEEEEESLMDLISGGVYSKSYQEAKEVMKKNASDRDAKGKKGRKEK